MDVYYIMFSTFSSLSSLITKKTGSLIGTNWTLKQDSSIIGGNQFTTNGQQNGTMIEMSTNGQYILAVAQSAGKVIVSTDFGATWSSKTSANGQPSTMTPSGCGVSTNGDIMYVAHNGGSVYKSVDYGASWSATSAPAINYYGLSCSSDGTKILVSRCATGTNSNFLYYSSDSGSSWANIASGLISGSTWFSSYNISPDGSKIMVTGYGDGIWYTSNAGTSWTKINTNAVIWGAIVVANNGNAVVTHDINLPNSVYLYNGSSWTGVGTVPNDTTRNVACSDDLSVMLVAQRKSTGNGVLYLSLDSGTTWTNLTSIGVSYWQGVGVSGDGKYIMCSGSALNSRNGLYQSFN